LGPLGSRGAPVDAVSAAPVDAVSAAPVDAVSAAPHCPFCGAGGVERVGQWGGQIITAQ